MTTVLTISLPTTLLYPFASMCDSQQDEDNVSAPARSSITCDWVTGRPNGLHLPPLLPTLLNQLLQTDATMTRLCIFLPPLRASRQDEDNVRPSIDTFEREPGRQPGVLLLPLHSTLIPPESLGTSEAVRLISISLPPLNLFDSMRDFRQDEDNDVRSARPWLNHDTRAGGIDLRDDLLVEGFEPDTMCITLDGSSIESLAGFREFYFCRCPRRYLMNKRTHL